MSVVALLVLMTTMSNSASEIVNRAWSAGLRPPPDLTLWEWSDEKRILGPDSPEPGPYRSSRTPYIRGIAEALSPSHPATDITVMKGSQTGLTTLGINWVGYIVDLYPRPILITLPSEGVAREWSTQRLAQLVDETPCLEGKIIDAAKRHSGNTTFSKKFSGGYFMKIAWSSSAKKLRSTPAAYLLSDEVDGFEGDAEGEGDPVLLLNRRSTNFQGAKHFKISTPKDALNSRINREFLAGDQRYFFVPCPHCGHHQVIRWTKIRWEKGEYSTCRLECIGCGKAIREEHKTKLLDNGIWVATRDRQDLLDEGFASLGDPRVMQAQTEMVVAEKVSFHLSALYSPLGWYSWQKAAEEWEAAQKDPGALKVFVMTVLGEVWVNRGEAPAWEQLYQRRREYPRNKAPQGVLFLTAGVDVQKDYIETEVVGWGRDLRSWSINYERFSGDPSNNQIWQRLEEYLGQYFPTELGYELPVMTTVIDSGHLSTTVYSVCRRHHQPYVTPAAVRITRPGTWLPSKGGTRFDKLLENVSTEDAARKRGGLKVFTIGTGFAKLELYDWLNAKPVEVDGSIHIPAGYCEFPSYEPAYFQGIVAETLVVDSKGKRKWVRDPRVRNEPLDIRIMARLGAHLVLPPRASAIEAFWSRLEREMGPRKIQAGRKPLVSPNKAADPVKREGPARLRAPRPVYSGDDYL